MADRVAPAYHQPSASYLLKSATNYGEITTYNLRPGTAGKRASNLLPY